MKRIVTSLLLAAGIALAGLSITPESTAQLGIYRIGAMCNDGTTSSATGSGACSWHGGVACWIYSDGSCR
jgi:hypothetical protein